MNYNNGKGHIQKALKKKNWHLNIFLNQTLKDRSKLVEDFDILTTHNKREISI